MREETLNTFKEKYYNELRNEILIKSLKLFENNLEQTQIQIYAHMEQFLSKLNAYELTNITINISIPYIDICNDSPSYMLSIYEGVPFVGNEIVSERYTLPWEVYSWKEQVEILMDNVKQNNMQVYLHKPSMEALHRKSIKYYLKIISAYLKEFFRNIEDISLYTQIESYDDFLITFGEYYDWQNVIYRKRISKNIVGLESSLDFSYMKYCNENYENHILKGLNFNDTNFSYCIFKGCELNNISLSNTIFNNCVFNDCSFDYIKFYGTNFMNCEFQNVKIMKGQSNYFNLQNNTCEFYGLFRIKDSKLKYVKFIECDLTYLEFYYSNLKYVDFEDSILNESTESLVGENK
ncbi:MAG: pentapeptide repeat-containing protein [Eubacteriales bacterium]